MQSHRDTHCFTRIVVRKPGSSLVNGITSAELGSPDLQLARTQHEAYIACLRECGVTITIMEAEENYPDSVFIEDTAIVTNKLAIVTRPAPQSRQGEVESVSELLQNHFEHMEYIEEPGTLEGGDVLQIGNTFFVGISARTNKTGAEQLIGILESFGFQGFKIQLRQLLHLKTGVSFLGQNTIVVSEELAHVKHFKHYTKIIVKKDEAYAANCIRVNDYVLFPKGFPHTLKALTDAGFNVKEVEMSEFRKLDGGLSCLSLRF